MDRSLGVFHKRAAKEGRKSLQSKQSDFTESEKEKICSVSFLFSCVFCHSFPWKPAVLLSPKEELYLSIYRSSVHWEVITLKKRALTAVAKALSGFHLWKKDMFSTGCSKVLPKSIQEIAVALLSLDLDFRYNFTSGQATLLLDQSFTFISTVNCKNQFQVCLFFFLESIALFPFEMKIHYLINRTNII